MTLIVFLLAFALVLRLTRLITTDKITQPLRDRLSNSLSPYRHGIYTFPQGVELKPWTLRARFGAFVAELTDCDWCTSIWLAAAIAPFAWYHGDSTAFQILAIAAAFSWLTGFAINASDALERHSNY